MSPPADPTPASEAAAARVEPASWWSLDARELQASLGSSDRGLSADDVARRLLETGPNVLGSDDRTGAWRLLLRQFSSPLVIILLIAAMLSALAGDWIDAGLVSAILVGSAALGMSQEWRASRAVAVLTARVRTLARVVRDSVEEAVPVEGIVPGDIVLLRAGSLVPADGRILDARDCFVSEAPLTGETYPVDKSPGVAASGASLTQRTNCLFRGTSVRSGTATMLVVTTGRRTEYGGIAQRLAQREPMTEFERGVRRFGGFLTRIMVVIVVIVLAANVLLGRPLIESLLFAAALAVGLSPELLPAIIGVTLAHGARLLAERGVIVRRLESIEDLGSMDVLCTDKTGTLTEGVVRLEHAVDPGGAADPRVLETAFVNASLQTGLTNPLDEAVVDAGRRVGLGLGAFEKVDETPWDFVRKRVGVVVRRRDAAQPLLMVKGALAQVLDAFRVIRIGGAERPLDDAARADLLRRLGEWSAQGLRVLGVAERGVPAGRACRREDEAGMTFTGFLVFADPPKRGAAATVAELARLGIRLKMITGDNRLVGEHVARALGIEGPKVVTGDELNGLAAGALARVVVESDVFAEVDPDQKERIVIALQHAGHVVGFLGDGINDAPALKAADVGISVEGAADVAREAADFVLLRSDLDVIANGVRGGRVTFANTLKYIAITMSANLGNMISMAAASLVLPFLPLLATQILLNNFLSDIPAAALASDRVDDELTAKPHRWNIASIRRFMLTFGLISSAFDLLTFGVLYATFRLDAVRFRTGWFVESLLTELAVLMVLRTSLPAWRSRPGRPLVVATAAVAIVALASPWLPGSRLVGFVPLPWTMLAALVAITLAFAGTCEWAKRRVGSVLLG